MFASAFYLVGLGHYASAVFAELGVRSSVDWRNSVLTNHTPPRVTG